MSNLFSPCLFTRRLGWLWREWPSARAARRGGARPRGAGAARGPEGGVRSRQQGAREQVRVLLLFLPFTYINIYF